MVVVLTVFCVFVVLFSYVYHRNLHNPQTIMFTIWGIIIPLSAMGIYGMNATSDHTYSIIFIGLISYLIGSFLGSISFGSRKTTQDSVLQRYVEPESVRINYTFLYILYLISLIHLLYASIEVVRLLLSGYQMDYVRKLYTSQETNELRSSATTVILRNFLSTPTVYLSIAVLPIDFIKGKKDKRLFWMTVALIGLWVLSSGGRSIIIWVCIYFFVVYIMHKKIKLKRKTKIFLAIGIIALFLLILYMTYSRKGNDVDLLRQMYIYFVVPIKHFDYRIDIIDREYSTLYGFGISSFYGFLYPFLYLFRFLGIFSSYPEIITTIRYLSFEWLEKSVYLGGTVTMNAFVTMFFQPYLDGRIPGVLIVCALFGIVCGYAHRRAYVFRDNKWLLIYLLLYQKLCFSMVRFYFTQSSQTLCLIFALFAISHSGNSKKKLETKLQ